MSQQQKRGVGADSSQVLKKYCEWSRSFQRLLARAFTTSPTRRKSAMKIRPPGASQGMHITASSKTLFDAAGWVPGPARPLPTQPKIQTVFEVPHWPDKNIDPHAPHPGPSGAAGGRVLPAAGRRGRTSRRLAGPDHHRGRRADGVRPHWSGRPDGRFHHCPGATGGMMFRFRPWI